ncbi:hypothetical protein FACS1894151_03080 [Spirochaetia bacterium]|nr:hypothetical protein FACS1894151_03080 [Spirochaetia bacterium]
MSEQEASGEIIKNARRVVSSRETAKALLAAFVIALCMKLFLFDFMVTDGRSMLPVIQPGTILLVNRVAYGFRLPWSEHYLFSWALPKTGDIIVFYSPHGEPVVKRCSALVAANKKFIALGDNSLESYDSRSYGPVPIDHIVGKVLGVK